MAEEDVVIEIRADEQPVVAEQKVETAPEKVDKPAKAEPKVEKTKTTEDDAVNDLKSQVETLRADKVRTETELKRQRDETARTKKELEQTRGDVVDTQANAIENAIAAAQSAKDTAKRDYASAMAEGDFNKAADAQEKIAESAARMLRLTEAQSDLEVRKAAPKQPERVIEEAPADPFEAAIAKISPRSQAWLREHKEYVTDPKLNMKANAADLKARAEGYIPDTDAYFDFCERELGLKQDEPQIEAQPAPKSKRYAMPAAPVSRDGHSPTNGNLGSGQVLLTPGEQRAATDGTHIWNYDDPKLGAKKGEPIGLKEFARRKASMTASGFYDRSYTEQ